MSTKLIEYCQHAQEKYDLLGKRKQFVFDINKINIIQNIENPILLRENIIEFITGLIGEQVQNIEIVTRTFTNNEFMKFHVDDCQIVTRTFKPLYNTDRFVQIYDNTYLYINSKTGTIPRFTTIFYLSTMDEQFTGGIFEFADNTQVVPKAGTGILFDSREAHRVLPVKKGTRESIVVKIY